MHVTYTFFYFFIFIESGTPYIFHIVYESHYNAVIHCPTDILQYSLSAIQMNVPRFLHELTK